MERLDGLARHEAAVPELRAAKGAVFVEPALVREVTYLEMTKSTQKMRAPVFLRMRPHKAPEDCLLEPPASGYPPGSMWGRIVFGTDGSAAASRAGETTATIARAVSAKLTMITGSTSPDQAQEILSGALEAAEAAGMRASKLSSEAVV